MLLAVDVGNTQTVFGLFDGPELAEHWRIATEAQRTGDELGALVTRFLDLARVHGICLSSTVPQLVREYEAFAERYAEAPLLVLGPGVRTGIPIRHDSPHEIGPDRLANAVAAKDRYGAPCIVVDFGTSTNFDVVSPAGEYVGGVLAPGVEISMDALFSRARAADQGRLRRPAGTDRYLDGDGASSRGSSTGSQGRWTASPGGSASSSGSRHRWSRRAVSPI